MLAELVNFITDRTLSAAEVGERVAAIEAQTHDLALKIGDIAADEVEERAEYYAEVYRDILGFGVTLELFDYFIVNDTLDDFHDNLQGMFADSLPPFPHAIGEGYAGENKKTTALDYFTWLAPLLVDYGDYEVLIFDPRWDDNMYGLVVSCEDTVRVLELAKGLNIEANRAVDVYRQ